MLLSALLFPVPIYPEVDNRSVFLLTEGGFRLSLFLVMVVLSFQVPGSTLLFL